MGEGQVLLPQHLTGLWWWSTKRPPTMTLQTCGRARQQTSVSPSPCLAGVSWFASKLDTRMSLSACSALSLEVAHPPSVFLPSALDREQAPNSLDLRLRHTTFTILRHSPDSKATQHSTSARAGKRGKMTRFSKSYKPPLGRSLFFLS